MRIRRSYNTYLTARINDLFLHNANTKEVSEDTFNNWFSH